MGSRARHYEASTLYFSVFASSREANLVSSLYRGYLNNPDATRESFSPDGWLKTGDVSYADEDGFFYIVDRRKEFIKYNAYQGEGLILCNIWHGNNPTD